MAIAAGVIPFILLGRYFERRSTPQAGAALRALLELGAKEFPVLRDGPDGKSAEERISIEELTVGDEFVVRPGEKIATDGDAVTGAPVHAGDRIVVRATRIGSDTQLAQMATPAALPTPPLLSRTRPTPPTFRTRRRSRSGPEHLDWWVDADPDRYADAS